MPLSIDKFKSTFREEAYELLGRLEDDLLELESRPSDTELINAAFRAIHTVKGSAAMFGYDEVSKFAHELETVLDLCRSGTLAVSKDFIGVALKCRDHLKRLLDFDAELPSSAAEEGESLLARLGAFVGKGGETATFRISFKPAPGIFRNGTRVLNLVEELAALGQADIFPHMEGVPPLETMEPETCYTWWDVVLTCAADENAIRDIFIFVEDQAELRVERIAEQDDEGKKLGEILVERGDVSKEDLREALGSQKKLGEVLVESKLVSKPQVDSALVEQEHLKKLQGVEAVASSIRVASDKLDALVDLVGELVTLQARLAQLSLGMQDSALASVSEQFERLIAQLRDNTMSIRMLPIGSTFNKFRRVVRDLALDLGKEAELITEGAETELDKTVIEKLGDPLVHIIRNSMDHGIEAPGARALAGKPSSGTIKLSAHHSGAYVLIQVSDDGKGLDREAIRSKAIERGLVAAGQDLEDQELYQLVFEPGFSTARKVSTVSGRGVGMDVVKREIDSLGGSVYLDTRPGVGMTVTLKIPLTLAIIEGLLVRIGSEHFVVPLSSVDGCIEIARSELETLGRRGIVSYRDELVPFVRLRDFFDFGRGDDGAAEPEIEQMVIAAAQESRVGLVVDQVVGDYQTVIKPLGRMYRDVDGISGATILGDGAVALIIDVNRLAFAAQKEGGRKAATGV